MILKINIQPYQIQTRTTLTAQENSFPILTIDKDSYIVEASIETGLDFHFNDGC